MPNFCDEVNFRIGYEISVSCFTNENRQFIKATKNFQGFTCGIIRLTDNCGYDVIKTL